MITIPIFWDMIEEATKNAKEIRNAAINKGFESVFQTGDPMRDHVLGYLGEIVFRQCLKQEGIPFEELYVVGQPDEGDFKVNGRVIDVKTGWRKYPIESIRDNFKFLVAVQTKWKQVYVNVLINKDFTMGYVMGYVEQDEVEKYPVLMGQGKGYRAIPIGNLRPIGELQ